MADTKISALPAAAAAAGTNELAINEAGASKKLTVAQIRAFALGTATPLIEAGSGAAGTAAAGSHEDHVHPGAFASAAPALTLGTTNAAGSASTGIATDATILAFDATAPSTQAFGDAAAVGAAAVAARRDHKHAMMAAPAAERAAASTTPAAVGTAAVGTGTTDARADHVHATGAGTPSTQAFGDAAATGTGPAAAMTDHKHGMPAAVNLWIGSNSFNIVASRTPGGADVAQYQAFTVNVAVTVTKCRIHITVQSGNVDVGIYGATGTRLGSTGSTAAATGGTNQEIALTAGVALVPGTLYYASLAADNNTVTFWDVGGALGMPYSPPMTFFTITSFPLPATVTVPASGTTTRQPLIVFEP